jgi:hypothetical protein
MNDDGNQFDALLAEDWMDPGDALLLKALAKHPQRDHIRALNRERDEHGLCRWSMVRLVEDDVDDPWVEVWLVPHPSDRPEDRWPVKVGTWPLRIETAAVTHVPAVIDEHGDTQR